MRIRWRHGLELITVFALFLSAACETVVTRPEPPLQRRRASSSPNDVRVVIFVIDGPRHSETFGDPMHAHVPGMWNTLRTQGTLCSNFRNLGLTLTNPGHGTLLSGVWQYIDNEGVQRIPQPTLFEYYRKATGATAADAVLISGKLKFDALTYSTNPDFGAAYGASSYLGIPNDLQTYDRLIQQLDQDAPHLVMCSFSDVDQAAHSGVWTDYLRAIDVVDSLTVLTWEYLQSDPDYAGKTYMFITADHGRHDNAHGGFQSHGDGCDGCRHIIFLALGPDIRTGYEVTSPWTQRDLCYTVGTILGIPTPMSAGLFLEPIFSQSPTGVLH